MIHGPIFDASQLIISFIISEHCWKFTSVPSNHWLLYQFFIFILKLPAILLILQFPYNYRSQKSCNFALSSVCNLLSENNKTCPTLFPQGKSGEQSRNYLIQFLLWFLHFLFLIYIIFFVDFQYIRLKAGIQLQIIYLFVVKWLQESQLILSQTKHSFTTPNCWIFPARSTIVFQLFTRFFFQK